MAKLLMRGKGIGIRSYLLVLAIVTTAAWAADAARLEDVTVAALGPLDGRAVVKTADGKMQVLKLGDTISGTKAIVTQVLTDKLVVEEEIADSGQQSAVSAMKQTVWIFKPTKAGEKSKVQRLDREGPPKPPIAMPAVKK